MSAIMLGGKDIAEYSDGHSAGDMQKVYSEGFGCGRTGVFPRMM